MSNLGMYQKIVQWSKIVGGPIKLIFITAVGGYVIIRSGEAGVKKVYKVIKGQIQKVKNDRNLIFEVTAEGKDKCGLEFAIGDKYKVLESDGESIVIEKIGDLNNPYVVSNEFLMSISNYA